MILPGLFTMPKTERNWLYGAVKSGFTVYVSAYMTGRIAGYLSKQPNTMFIIRPKTEPGTDTGSNADRTER